MNGQVFDSSVERGETISFPLANVIKGINVILFHVVCL
jgi:FKBP-type peptidyl-prolyl cis-trans isomerase